MARSYQELERELKFKRYPAKEKKFSQRVLMVHFFGGNQRLLKRHINLMNELGLDVYAFDLSYSKKFVYKKVPDFKNQMFKVRKIWAEEIREVLAYVPGPLITYGFSGPAACAIQVAKDYPQKVVGLISDSGPFTHLLRCNYNLAKVEFGLNKPWQRILATGLLSPLWDLKHTSELLDDLAMIPKGTPYLSIQPVLDPVVPVQYMEDVFQRSKHQLDLKVLRLEESGHLDGLKKQPEKYKSYLESWLKKHFA